MIPKPGEYCIVRGARKNMLVVILEDLGGGKRFRAKEFKVDYAEDEKSLPVEITRRDIFCNMGKAPRPGKAFGVSVSVPRAEFDTNFWGRVVIYDDLDPDVVKALRSKMIASGKYFKSQRLTGLNLVTEIRPLEGKYAGMYHHNSSKEFDVMELRPGQDLCDDATFHYIVSHEYGHGIWYRQVPERMKSRWINMYHKSVQLTEVLEDELSSICEEIVQAGSIRAFLKECEEEDARLVRQCLRHVSQVHGLSKANLEVLLANNEEFSLGEVWPKLVELSEKDVLMTEYSTKNSEEFFAEAFALHCTGKKLPKAVDKLMTATLSKLLHN